MTTENFFCRNHFAFVYCVTCNKILSMPKEAMELSDTRIFCIVSGSINILVSSFETFYPDVLTSGLVNGFPIQCQESLCFSSLLGSTTGAPLWDYLVVGIRWGASNIISARRLRRVKGFSCVIVCFAVSFTIRRCCWIFTQRAQGTVGFR